MADVVHEEEAYLSCSSSDYDEHADLWITCASILHRPKYVSTLQLHKDTARLPLLDRCGCFRTTAVSCGI